MSWRDDESGADRVPNSGVRTRIGVGLPSAVAGTSWPTVLGWATRAQELGFDAVVTIDRLVYDSFEPLVVLAAVAAVTDTIDLVTNILIAPVRSTGVLAKQAATLAAMADRRVVLGLGLGARPDDYDAAGAQWRSRGRRFDGQLDELRAIWGGEPRGMAGAIGPTLQPPLQPQVVIGGSPQFAAGRVARAGDGWTMAFGSGADFRDAMAVITAAWQRAGRHGAPRGMTLVYFALGERAASHAARGIGEYYAHAPAERVAAMIANVATTPEAVRARVDEYSAAGAHDVLLLPCAAEPEQLELLAEALGTRRAQPIGAR